MVALFVVTLVLVLIATVTKQIGNYSNKTKQISAVLELRARTAVMIRDQGKWLDKQRAMPATPNGGAAKFLLCIPSITSLTTTYTCPTGALVIPAGSDLEAYTNRPSPLPPLSAIDTELVDTSGVKIAGVLNFPNDTDQPQPHYLNNDGSVCTKAAPNTSCPIQSVGYFLRENATGGNPGEVKFLVKILDNPDYHRSKNMTPMKPQFAVLDLSTNWSASNAGNTGSVCSLPNVQTGIDSSGAPICMSPTQQCGPGLINLGLLPGGTLNCKTLNCAGSEAILNSSGNIECASTTPCAVGEVFMGYYTGSGQAMCVAPTSSCPANHVSMGPGLCTSVPTNCTADQELAFYNGAFSCVSSDNPGGVCPANQIVVGIDANGTPQCEAERVPECNAGQTLTSIGNGRYSCAAPPTTLPNCRAGQSLIASGSGYTCANPPAALTVPNCNSGQVLTSNGSGGLRCAAMPVPRTRCQICHKPHGDAWACTGWVNAGGGISEAGPFRDHGDTGKRSHIRLHCESY